MFDQRTLRSRVDLRETRSRADHFDGRIGYYTRSGWPRDIFIENFPSRWAFLPSLPACPARNRVFLVSIDRLARLECRQAGYSLPRGFADVDGVADAATSEHVA